MQNVLLVIQILICVAMVGVILVQRTAQDGGGLTGGSSTMGGLFTARGSANLLTRITAILATLFIVNSLALGYIASSLHQTRSVLDQVPVQSAPATTAPAKPTAPASESPASTPQVPVAK
jgi:preprotein translocase subunit SecG